MQIETLLAAVSDVENYRVDVFITEIGWVNDIADIQERDAKPDVVISSSKWAQEPFFDYECSADSVRAVRYSTRVASGV